MCCYRLQDIEKQLLHMFLKNLMFSCKKYYICIFILLYVFKSIHTYSLPKKTQKFLFLSFLLICWQQFSRSGDPAVLLSCGATSSNTKSTKPGACVAPTFPQQCLNGGPAEACRSHYHISAVHFPSGPIQ